jgi:hypothetical protein
LEEKERLEKLRFSVAMVLQRPIEWIRRNGIEKGGQDTRRAIDFRQAYVNKIEK